MIRRTAAAVSVTILSFPPPAAAFLALLLFALGANAQTADEAAIAKLLHGMFDRPESQLTIAPVVVAGDHAIAGCTQGEMGRRALRRKKDQQWSLILCAGDEIKSAHTLMTAGIASQEATVLEHDLANAESALRAECPSCC